MWSWQECQGLIAGARDGDRSAFEKLVEHYDSHVRSLISIELGERLGRRVEVDDLLQETFLRAFEAIEQFRGQTEGKFGSWLDTIARRVVQGEARRLKALKAGLDRNIPLDRAAPGGENELPAPQAVPPSQALRREERFERLKKALNALPPDYREVIRLARLEGLPVKEVARRMHRSEKATSVLLVRAQLKLKTIFGDTESLHLPQRSVEENR